MYKIFSLFHVFVLSWLCYRNITPLRPHLQCQVCSCMRAICTVQSLQAKWMRLSHRNRWISSVTLCFPPSPRTLTLSIFIRTHNVLLLSMLDFSHFLTCQNKNRPTNEHKNKKHHTTHGHAMRFNSCVLNMIFCHHRCSFVTR